MYIPYTYLIGWSKENKFYYGVQYGRKANPKNLWKTYFTSSKEVKSFINHHGNPDIIEIRRTFQTGKSALLWEQKVLKRLDAGNNDKFLNLISANDMHLIRLVTNRQKNITNGYINGKIPVSQDIPNGYWRGTTKFPTGSKGIPRSKESNLNKSKAMQGLEKSKSHRLALSVAAKKQHEEMSEEEKLRIKNLFSKKYSGENNPRFGCVVSDKQKELNIKAHHERFVVKIKLMLNMSLDEFKEYVKLECENGSNFAKISKDIGISWYHINRYCN